MSDYQLDEQPNLDPEKQGHLELAYELGFAVGYRRGYNERGLEELKTEVMVKDDVDI